MHSVPIVILYVTVNNIKNFVYYTNMLLWRIHFAGNNKKCLRFYVKCPFNFADIKKNWTFLTHLPRSS